MQSALAIDLIRSAVNREMLSEGAAFTMMASKLFFQTEDMKKGVDASLKKRKPIFRGI